MSFNLASLNAPTSYQNPPFSFDPTIVMAFIPCTVLYLDYFKSKGSLTTRDYFAIDATDSDEFHNLTCEFLLMCFLKQGIDLETLPKSFYRTLLVFANVLVQPLLMTTVHLYTTGYYQHPQFQDPEGFVPTPTPQSLYVLSSQWLLWTKANPEIPLELLEGLAELRPLTFIRYS